MEPLVFSAYPCGPSDHGGLAWSWFRMVLPYSLQNLDRVSFKTLVGGTSTVSQWLDTSFNAGFIVLHWGEIVYERYFNGMTERACTCRSR